MAQALPVHIIHEIERRWERRLDARPQAEAGKSADCSVRRCPLCNAPTSIELAIPGIAVLSDDVCGGCGHARRYEA